MKRIFFQGVSTWFTGHISKTKNRKSRKIDFSFLSEHCATFYIKKMKTALFEGRGEGLYGVNEKKRQLNSTHYFLRFCLWWFPLLVSRSSTQAVTRSEARLKVNSPPLGGPYLFHSQTGNSTPIRRPGTYVSRHHRGSINGAPETPRTWQQHGVSSGLNGALNWVPWCREVPVSETRLLEVCSVCAERKLQVGLSWFCRSILDWILPIISARFFPSEFNASN